MLNIIIKYKILSLLILCWAWLAHYQAQAQLINNGATIVIKNGASITTSSQLENQNNGQITNEGSLLIKGNLNYTSGTLINSGNITLLGNLQMNGLLTSNSNSAFILTGTSQEMNGTSSLRFWNLLVGNNLSFLNQKVTLNQNIIIANQLNLLGIGYINLNGKNINFGQTGKLVGENEQNRIREEGSGGFLQASNRTDVENIAGLGISLVSSANLGNINVKRGHDAFTNQAGQSIRRYFDITTTNPVAKDETKLTFRYFNTEIAPNQIESNLQLSESKDAGVNWQEKQGSLSEDGNFIETSDFSLVANQTSRWTIFEKNLPLRVSSNTPICSSELRLEANQIEGATYTWTGPNNFTATGRTPVIPFSTNLQSGIYKVIAKVNGSELVGETQVIIGSSLFNTETRPISCIGGADGVIRATSTHQSTLTFLLVNNNGTVLGTQTGTNAEFNNLSKGDYTIISQNNTGCQTTNKVTVTEQNFVPVDAGRDVSILRGSSIQLQATGASTYTWTPSNTLDNPNTATPTARPDVTTIYKVTGRNAQGCESTDEVTVFVLETLNVSKVLSPNNDGVNDFWTIERIEDFPNAEIVVYNRWGQEVFATKSYQNNWNGTGVNGALPEATYYYVIKIDDNKFISGFFSLVR
ncbi:gliding motility-associated C-terminal domain-containing protein [Thermoflexibacter ruber]|uniref:Gliding motility-associated C-terminal domain-containing protein n=1 Tax=Thermoflexibacter ruber TaxID=1003 RepID=A0A1I2DAT9_9BACT|nr:gliding motility-associated C-terminal domain-containing protein [Thermoflexibacter ruber]SFE77636.1 gliding motility-associated C-terminal domain-containing protein [Thermoflexibacter ruber]